LIVLSILPAIGGYVRLSQLGGSGPMAPDHVRFAAAPIITVLHIVSSLLYAILGALQFSPAVLRWSPKWHRNVGKVLILSGLVAALTGIWMTLTFPIFKPEGLPGYDGVGLYVTRLLVGVAMTWFIVDGYRAIRQRNIPRHKAMMMRSYALGIGAGTQAVTHIPWFLFPSIHGELARTVFMAAGWAINLAVAEWLIARKQPRAKLSPSH
jgi:uncharacterized membrane protein